VNAKLSNDGLDELNTVKFYEKIQAALSADCHITAVDSREALRAAWLTYGNQENHYTGWECALVNLGFGRWASEGEKGKSGNVHFYHDQVRRVVQFDEMGFSLDGSKNGKGGRPTATPTNPFLPESGKPVNKSSGKTSWMFGCNFADEALPPMVVLPSTAETPRVKAHLIRNMHQVRGKFGYPTERGFSCTFAVSENAGVTDKIFLTWVQEVIVLLYPDAADVPGKRVLLKADSGPGRFSSVFRCVSRAHGICFFPGLPNGTELGQEMDQVFALLKTYMERSRHLMFQRRSKVDGEKAQTTIWDVPNVLFGGTVKFNDGTSLDFPNNFVQGLSPACLERARLKCGYIPATRVALKSDKLRHELFLNSQGEIDEDADPLGMMLDQLEKQNHKVEEELAERGFFLAKNLKRSISRISATRREARSTKTLPNTRERQKALMGISTAGEWFKITNGGVPMNCDDAIIALELSRLVDIGKKLASKKKELLKRKDQIQAGERIIATKGSDVNTWNMDHYKKMIQYRNPQVAVSGLNKPRLEALWKKHKNHPLPPVVEWTKKDERQLQKAQSGNIDCIEGTHLMRRATQDKTEFLKIKLSTLPKPELLKIIGGALRDLEDLERQEFFNAWEEWAEKIFDDDDDSTVSTLDVSQLIETQPSSCTAVDDADSLMSAEILNVIPEDDAIPENIWAGEQDEDDHSSKADSNDYCRSINDDSEQDEEEASIQDSSEEETGDSSEEETGDSNEEETGVNIMCTEHASLSENQATETVEDAANAADTSVEMHQPVTTPPQRTIRSRTRAQARAAQHNM
jgi:hypothetical protein